MARTRPGQGWQELRNKRHNQAEMQVAKVRLPWERCSPPCPHRGTGCRNT